MTLEEIDIRSQLLTRPRRVPDPEGLDRALAVLAREMGENPRGMLQTLVETAVDLCKADTGGISLLEGDVFRWEAVAGVFASYRNGTMPREASPCGVCVDQNVTQLMHLADRHFPALQAEPRFVEALLIPFRVHGKPVGAVWIVSHTNDRKFDQEDERIVRTLSQFASAGWQLWKAAEAAEAANARKDEFLALLGHEFRNPLAAVLSATEILQTVATTRPAAHALELVARQAQHLARMVDDLLDASRVGRGTLELQMGHVDLQSVVAEAIEVTRAQIERRGHQVSLELPKGPMWIRGDSVRLVQMIANLLDNAAKYTPRGGQIWLTATHVDGRIAISVRDSGIGIPEGQLHRVFELFKQLEPSAEGLGVGLTLVRNLAELHGGSVEVISEGPGKGSQFTVRLPSRQAPHPTSQAPIFKAASTPAPQRILVVEDNEDVAASFAMALRLDSHDVRIAHDGPMAMDLLADFKPEVVLLDLGLPGINGYEVARRMREETLEACPTIIALSGYGGEEDRKQSKQAGCDAHLVKPVDPAVLRTMLGVGAPISPPA